IGSNQKSRVSAATVSSHGGQFGLSPSPYARACGHRDRMACAGAHPPRSTRVRTCDSPRAQERRSTGGSMPQHNLTRAEAQERAAALEVRSYDITLVLDGTGP